MIKPQKFKGTVITQTEIINTDFVVTGTGYTVRYNEAVNPGNQSMFPWLSTIAQHYEKYQFLKLEFIYTPFVPYNTPGQVLMAFDSDVYDTIPLDQVEMSQTKPNIVGRVMQTKILRIQNSKVLFTRGSILPPGDQKTYDIGRFILAFYQVGDLETLAGNLRVRYTIRLSTPQPNAGVPGDAVKFITTPTTVTTTQTDELEGLLSMRPEVPLQIRSRGPANYLINWLVSGIVPPSLTVSGTGLSAPTVVTSAANSFVRWLYSQPAGESVITLVPAGTGDLSFIYQDL